MNFIKDSDFLIEVAKGNVKNHSLITVLGRNKDVDTSIVDIGMLDINFIWPTVATTYVALSNDPTDSILDTGARKILIEGLDSNFDPISEEVEMNGTSESTATTASFIRINKTRVISTGTYATTLLGANNGNIIIGPSGGGSPLSYIANVEIDPGASQDCKYTVPNGYTAIVLGVGANIDSTKTGTLVINLREGADIVTAPFTSKIATVNVAGFAGLHTVPRELLNFKILAKTDIWASAKGGVNNTEIEISLRLLLKKD